MLVDVLRSGKSVFSLFYVPLFNYLLHAFFDDTEDCTEKAKLKYRMAIFFLVSN